MIGYRTTYRVGAWLPLLVPAAVALLVHRLRVPVPPALQDVVEILLASLLYGGVPYALLALWATWWIGRHSEMEIRRLMFRAPLLMVAVFFVFAIVAGLMVGRPGVFAALGLFGAIIIVPLGYVYVGIVVLLRQVLGPKEGLPTPARRA